MFSLVSGFTVQWRKWSMTLEGIDTSSSREKRPRRSPSNSEAQKEWTVVLEKSPDLASDD